MATSVAAQAEAARPRKSRRRRRRLLPLQPRAGNGRLLRRPPPWRLCAHRDAHSARVAFTGTAGRAMRQHAPLITTRPKRRLVSRPERERLATRGRQAKGSGRFGLGSARAGASPPNSGTDLTTGREAVVSVAAAPLAGAAAVAVACGEDEGTGSAHPRGQQRNERRGSCVGGGGSRLLGPPIVGASRDRSRMLEFLDRASFRCRKQWVSGGVIFIGGLARGLFMCSIGD